MNDVERNDLLIPKFKDVQNLMKELDSNDDSAFATGKASIIAPINDQKYFKKQLDCDIDQEFSVYFKRAYIKEMENIVSYLNYAITYYDKENVIVPIYRLSKQIDKNDIQLINLVDLFIYKTSPLIEQIVEDNYTSELHHTASKIDILSSPIMIKKLLEISITSKLIIPIITQYLSMKFNYKTENHNQTLDMNRTLFSLLYRKIRGDREIKIAIKNLIRGIVGKYTYKLDMDDTTKSELRKRVYMDLILYTIPKLGFTMHISHALYASVKWDVKYHTLNLK